MRLSDFDVLTFDCYGTLIDWETGIGRAIGPWLKRRGVEATPDEVLAAFAVCQSAQEDETPAMLYRDVVANTLKRMAKAWGVEATHAEARAFGASVGDWPAFADSPDALRYLKRHYRLAVLSNVDRASFARSNEKLGVAFDAVFTAEDIGSYKPSLRNFEYMLARLKDIGVARERILHTAQSRYHDHAPAQKLGLCTAWIDRRHGKPGAGATKPVTLEREPDFYFTGMAALVAAHRKELSG
jgi:2-haloalkanoic acid dehalogenase type II